jgi:hypothetical protein
LDFAKSFSKTKGLKCGFPLKYKWHLKDEKGRTHTIKHELQVIIRAGTKWLKG